MPIDSVTLRWSTAELLQAVSLFSPFSEAKSESGRDELLVWLRERLRVTPASRFALLLGGVLRDVRIGNFGFK